MTGSHPPAIRFLSTAHRQTVRINYRAASDGPERRESARGGSQLAASRRLLARREVSDLADLATRRRDVRGRRGPVWWSDQSAPGGGAERSGVPRPTSGQKPEPGWTGGQRSSRDVASWDDFGGLFRFFS